MKAVYPLILLMALVTYLIRALPLVFLRGRIRSPFLRSFLYYVPYVTLSVMIFPDVLSATGSLWSALAGFLAMMTLSFLRQNMFVVASASCLLVFLIEKLL
ncbi:MAG: AzlD domain-containing protein [Christensenellales bacterium]